MSDNVLRLSDYRQPLQSAADPPRDPAELAAMSYDAAVDWAGADFHRLAAVAKARDYRPEWIAHQLDNHDKQLSAQEAEILQRMIAAARPSAQKKSGWLGYRFQPDLFKPVMSALKPDRYRSGLVAW